MLATISLALNQNPILALVILIALIFLAWNLSLHWQVYQTSKKIKTMFKGTKVADLEGVIFEQIKRQRQTDKSLAELEIFAKNVEKMALSGLQKVGVIRFNPFKDTGGDQSFCVACLNAQNSGFTLSGLFTREGTRIYTKPIINGESKYPLTEEEKQAIAVAIEDEKSKFRSVKAKSSSK